MAEQPRLSSQDLMAKMIAVMRQDTLLQQQITREAEDLKKTVTEFKKYYFTEDDHKKRIPYPYRIETQTEYDRLSSKISSALEMVEDVVGEMKKRMFQLERFQQSPDSFSMNMSESSSKPTFVMADEPKPNILQRMTGMKRKKIINKNDPYQSSIPFFKRADHLMEFWDLHKQWHSEGLDFDEDEYNRLGYNAFLKNHRSMFSTEIEQDLLRIYQQGLTLRRMMEKQGFGAILQRSLTELKQQEQAQQQRL